MDLAELSDRQEIVDLITAYTIAVDTSAWESIADLFTEDALLDYRPAGGQQTGVVEAIEFIKNVSVFERWQHIIGQVHIELRGDEASATAYFTNPMVAKRPDGSEHVVEVGGYYRHELVRTPGGWRSRHLIDDIQWTRSS